jgi:Amt family ammonium transporter
VRATTLRLSVVGLAVAAQWLVAGHWLVFGMRAGFHVDTGLQAVLAALVVALAASRCGEGLSLPRLTALALVWSTLVFDPLARWCQHGWLQDLGVLDCGGAVPLHLSAGVAALVLAGEPRRAGADGVGGGATGHPGRVIAGAALMVAACVSLMAATTADRGPSLEAPALMAVTLGAAGGALGWLVVAWCDGGRSSWEGAGYAAVGGTVALASGAGFVGPSGAFAIGFTAGAVATGTSLGFIAGSLGSLLAITAAAGYVPPAMAIAIGCFVAALCHVAVRVRQRTGPGLGPDVFALHAIAGSLGALLTGVFARKASGAGVDGALFGHVGQLGTQLAACAVAAGYSAAATRYLAAAVRYAGSLDALRRAAGDGLVGGRSPADGMREPRAVRTSGVFQSRAFEPERLDVEVLLETSAADSAGALKS